MKSALVNGMMGGFIGVMIHISKEKKAAQFS